MTKAPVLHILRRATLCLLMVMSMTAVCAQEDLSVSNEEAEPAKMMSAYLKGLAAEAEEQRVAAYEAIKTPEDCAAHQQRLREFFVEQLGGFPARTPLNTQVTGRIDRGDYTIEKIIFESRPKHFVTGVLYLPKGEPPFPAVLVPCGHSANGKAAEAYQRGPILMAKNGMAAFCYDPIGQGERSQILDAEGKQRYSSTLEHTLVGVGAMLIGRNAASYRVHDGMRAIDFLQSREEIDGERIGCTGTSGGGTLTSYLMALDDRITAAAPSCYLTSLARLVETIGPQDAEQDIHAQIAFGMGHAEYVMMRAPKPTLMCTATRDFFDIEGSWDSFREAKRFYTRLGYPERVDLMESDDDHGFRQPHRTAAARWMRRWLLGIDDAVTEPEFEVLPDEDLLCTPNGQVMLLDGARSVCDLNADAEGELRKRREAFWSDIGGHNRTAIVSPDIALAEVREFAGIRPLDELPEPQVEKVGEIERDGYRIDKLVLRPEDGIMLPALDFVPADGDGNSVLWLNGEGKAVDAAPGGAIEELVRAGRRVLAVDLRGIGETESEGNYKGWGELFGLGWQDIFLAYMLDRSYLGMRAEDILVCARYLGDESPIEVVGIGEAGPPALHAAALEPDLFSTVTLRRSLVSWSNVVETPVSRNQLVNAVHGALEVYDLPDLLGCLPADKVTIEEPMDAAGQPADGGA